MIKSYYEILEVSIIATQDEIKHAFKILIKKYHPDNQETGDRKKFEEVLEAYETLSDLEKRKEYDRIMGFCFDSATDKTAVKQQTDFNRRPYYQYYSYTTSRERSEFEFDDELRKILKDYRYYNLNNDNIKKYDLYDARYDNNINISKYFNDYDAKEENIQFKKILHR